MVRSLLLTLLPGSLLLTGCANEPPVVAIDLPLEGQTFSQGAKVCFQGAATDPEEGLLPAGALTWDSSVDGILGTGNSFCRSDLSFGDHVITLRAVDGEGLTVSTRVPMSIVSPSALVGITNSLFCEGQETRLTVEMEGLRLDAATGESRSQRVVLDEYFFEARFDGGKCGDFTISGALSVDLPDVCFLFYNELDGDGNVVLSHRRQQRCPG